MEYTVVGGMPDAVQSFVDARDMAKVLSIQRDIVRGYEDDMVKYAPSADKPLIKQCFKSIPPSTGEGEQEVSVLAREEGLYGIAFCGQSSVDGRCRHNAPLQEPFHYRIAA